MTVNEARAAVIVGDGVVARYPGLLCVARSPDREVVARLLEVCASVAGPDPGRILARRLARWMGGLDAPGDDLEFGTVAAAGDQLGVFLVGATSVSVDGGTLSGADAATWTDRLIPMPDAPVVLALQGVVPPPGLAAGPNDLRAGVVPGAGAVLFAGPVDRHADDVPERARADYAWFTDPPQPTEPRPDPLLPADPGNSAAELSVDVLAAAAGNGHVEPSILEPGPNGRHAILERRSALGDDRGTAVEDVLDLDLPEPPVLPGDDAGAPPAPVAPVEDTALFHAVDPAPPAPLDPALSLPRRESRVPTQRGPEPRSAGSRLPLGRIVFDDGATFTVDAPYLVGRMPESDPRARSGELRPMVVDDDTGAVSRVHAEILIKGWDVVLVDSGSRNGTFVAGPDESGWTPLRPGSTSRLVPGTRVRMGGRTFVFEPGAVTDL